LFAYLINGEVREINPAASVSPEACSAVQQELMLSAAEAWQVLDQIESNTLINLRDRAVVEMDGL
jgi:site-specific recombinase XerC